MDAASARELLLNLSHVVETQQWGDNLVFWVGDKAIGGKMFCLLNLDAGGPGVASFAVGPERFHELLEREGLRPAPYFARIHWVAAETWKALRDAEWQAEFRAASELTYAKLPKRVKDTLTLAPKELAKSVAAQRKVLAAKAKGKSKAE